MNSYVLKATAEHDYEMRSARCPGVAARSFCDWLMYMPQDPVLPTGLEDQCLGEHRQRPGHLGVVFEYCVRGASRSSSSAARSLLLRTSSTPRAVPAASSCDDLSRRDAQLEIVLNELAAALKGTGAIHLERPALGSWSRCSPYGSFVERYCIGADGELELAPRTRLANWSQTVATRRSVTPWVTLPAFLTPHLERAAARRRRAPYRIDRALHSPTGGGVYVRQDMPSGRGCRAQRGAAYRGSRDGAERGGATGPRARHAAAPRRAPQTCKLAGLFHARRPHSSSRTTSTAPRSCRRSCGDTPRDLGTDNGLQSPSMCPGVGSVQC